MAEHYDVDPFGNTLPPGLFWRDGVYYVRKRVNGTRRKTSTGKRDFKSALRRYHEIMQAWNDGESGWTVHQVPTFKDYWLKDYRPAWTVRKTPRVGSNPKQPTFRDDQLVQTFLSEHGSRALDWFTPSICNKWANKRRGMTYTRKAGGPEYSIREGTVTREVSFLKAVFDKAVEDGHLTMNPWRSVQVEPYATRQRVLTPEEQEKLFVQLSPRFQRWALFMLGTGLRLEEARALREAEDVNFAQRWVRVTRKTRGRKKKVQDVPLIDPYLLDILQEQLTVDGQLWHQRQGRLRVVLEIAAKRAGIEHVSPHTLRHTFATRYLQGGGDIYVLSKVLGHSSVATTERVYAHLLTADLLQRSAHVALGLRAPVPATVLPFRRTATGSGSAE